MKQETINVDRQERHTMTDGLHTGDKRQRRGERWQKRELT